MNIIQETLKKAARRIRLLRGWRGFGFGLFVGALMALAWVALDLAGAWLTEWAWMGALVGTCAAVGLIVGWALPLHEKSVARSLDDRAQLKDRTTAVLETSASGSQVAEDIQREAAGRLEGVDVNKAYPFRFGPWVASACGCLVVAGAAFWVVNSGVLLSEEQKKDMEKLADVAAQVERIAKPLEEKTVDVDPGREEKDLAKRMVDMARKMERGRMDEEEAMRQAEQLTNDARKLAAERFDLAQNQMISWQQQMAKQEFEKAGLDQEKLDELNMSPEELALMQQMQMERGIDPESDAQNSERLDSQMLDNMQLSDAAKEMLKMTPEERDALKDSMQQEMAEMQSKMDSGELSESEMQELSERMKQMQELMKDLQLSEEVYEAMRQMMESETYRELQRLMAEMMEAQEQVESGEPMTQEEMDDFAERLQQMMEDLEEWAEMMDDPEFRQMVVDQMQDMLEAIKRGELTFEQCQECMGMFGMNGLMQMPGGTGGGGTSMGEGENRKQDRDSELPGETEKFGIRGQRQEQGKESYTEIKAPTTLGNRTSVPYNEVLPKYKNTAEEAMNGEQIPKKHEKRVKEYFESLGGGK